MSDGDSPSLRDKLEDGEYTIEVKETIRRGPKLALNKDGERTLSKKENQQLRDYMEQYRDLILDIDDASSELEGFERAWEIGRLMIDAKEEAEEAGEKFAFADIVPAISAFKKSLAYRYRLLYEMFPQGRYDSRYSHTTIAEMAQRAESPIQARVPYKRMVKADIRPTEGQVRAWGDSSDDLESIVEAVTDRVKNSHIEAVRNVAVLHGITPLPSKDEVKEVLDKKK